MARASCTASPRSTTRTSWTRTTTPPSSPTWRCVCVLSHVSTHTCVAPNVRYDPDHLTTTGTSLFNSSHQGDYWIGEAENLIKEIEDEEKEAQEDEAQGGSAQSKKRRGQARDDLFVWVDQSKPNPIPGPCLQPHLIARTIHPLFTNQPTNAEEERQRGPEEARHPATGGRLGAARLARPPHGAPRRDHQPGALSGWLVGCVVELEWVRFDPSVANLADSVRFDHSTFYIIPAT